MTQQAERIIAWADEARRKVRHGSLEETDIDELLLRVAPLRQRQRLLYLHTTLPTIRAEVISGALHEPVEGPGPQVDPLAPELPYNSVAEAVRDGWRVIHFPNHRAPFEDREIDVLGYEFVLEKLEAYDD